MARLTEVIDITDIPEKIAGTPVSLLLQYHNMQRPFGSYNHAQLLIGMCMDNRKSLKIPENFAYILRTGGANLLSLEFHVSYAVAVGGVRYIVLMAHNRCGMVNLISKKKLFVEGLISVGWKRSEAEKHFMNQAPLFEIADEIDFVLGETGRLQSMYPEVLVVPLYYNIDNNRLYLIS